MQRLLHLGTEICEQIVGRSNRERLAIDRRDQILLTLTIRVCRVADNVEPHEVPDTKPTSALGCHDLVLVSDHIIPQEHVRNVVQLEAVEAVLPAHVQEKIQTQPTPQHEIPQVILARRQLELLGLGEPSLPDTCALVLHLRNTAPEVDLVQDAQCLAAILDIRIIETEGVIPAEDVRILNLDLVCELADHVLLIPTRDELGVVVRRIYLAHDEHHSTSGVQHVVRVAVGDAHLDDRVTRIRTREHTGCRIHLQIIAGYNERNVDIGCSLHTRLIAGVELIYLEQRLIGLTVYGRTLCHRTESQRARRTQVPGMEQPNEGRNVGLIENAGLRNRLDRIHELHLRGALHLPDIRLC